MFEAKSAQSWAMLDHALSLPRTLISFNGFHLVTSHACQHASASAPLLGFGFGRLCRRFAVKTDGPASTTGLVRQETFGREVVDVREPRSRVRGIQDWPALGALVGHATVHHSIIEENHVPLIACEVAHVTVSCLSLAFKGFG